MGNADIVLCAIKIIRAINERTSANTVHLVKVNDFFIGKYPVTQKEWNLIMGGYRLRYGEDDYPVVDVTWVKAQEYLQKLSQSTGKHYRLPTEAEWEYVCRAGSTTEYCFGDDESQLGDYAWYKKNSPLSNSLINLNSVQEVGRKKLNAWGLYDMHGHVDELCQDWYDENYYAVPPINNPTGPPSGEERILRGGSCYDHADIVRSAMRFTLPPESYFHNTGFRCLREP